MIYLQQDARFAASRFLSSIADQNFGVEGGWRAIQQRMRSELSLSNFVFTGSGERDIHPTPQHTNLAAAHTSRHQNSLRSHTLLQTLTCAYHMSLPQEQIDARFDQGEAADGFTAAHRRQPPLSPLGAQLSRSARRSRRVGRSGSLTHPCVGCPRLSSLSTRSRLARRLSCRVCRRCNAPAFYGCWQGHPARVGLDRLAAARVRAIATDRLAAAVWHTAEAASSGFWNAVGALHAVAVTARVTGHWVGIMWVRCSRLLAVCERT